MKQRKNSFIIITKLWYIDNHRYKSAWVEYRRLNIGLPRIAKRCSRAPTHTYMWLASIIIENMLLMITYKNILSSLLKHSSSSPPKIWITPDLIIPPPSSFCRLSRFLHFCYRFMYVTFKREFVKPHLHCHLGFIFSIQYRICVLTSMHWSLLIDHCILKAVATSVYRFSHLPSLHPSSSLLTVTGVPARQRLRQRTGSSPRVSQNWPRNPSSRRRRHYSWCGNPGQCRSCSSGLSLLRFHGRIIVCTGRWVSSGQTCRQCGFLLRCASWNTQWRPSHGTSTASRRAQRGAGSIGCHSRHTWDCRWAPGAGRPA